MEDGALKSLTQFARLEDGWEPEEEQRAVCGKALEFDHQAPFSGCSCGLYAFYDWKTCSRYADGVASRGVVSAWGDLILCEYGFKAEYMRVEALLFDAKPYLNSSGAMWYYATTIKPTYEAVAERYNVPLIDVANLPSFLEELGGEILSPDPQPEDERDLTFGLSAMPSFRAAPLPPVQRPKIVGPRAASPSPKPLRWLYWMSVGAAVFNAIVALWQASILVGELNSPDLALGRITVVCVAAAINLACAWWTWRQRYGRESVDG